MPNIFCQTCRLPLSPSCEQSGSPDWCACRSRQREAPAQTIAWLKAKASPVSADPPAQAGLDVLRERHELPASMSQTRAIEDRLIRGEMIITAHQLMDSAAPVLPWATRRLFLVRAAALLIAEIERGDRAQDAIATEQRL